MSNPTPRAREPHGVPPRRDRSRVRALLILLVLILIGAGAARWGFEQGKPRLAAAGETCPSPSASPTPTKPLPAPGTVRLRVLNSTTRTGLAGRTARALRERGFKVEGVGNAGAPVTGVAEIRFGPAAAQPAKALARQVPGARLVPVKRTGPSVDLVLGQQFRQLASAAELNAAEHTALTATPCPSPPSG